MTAAIAKKEASSEPKHEAKGPSKATDAATKPKASADSKAGGAAMGKPEAKAVVNGGGKASNATNDSKPRPPPAAIPKLRGHHDAEPNPFEQSFRAPSNGNDSKGPLLPGVANLTSPNGGLAGVGQMSGWSSFGSLRNGPLSPAMLLGPTGLGGFDGTLRTGLTPNESSIRTGLTPRVDGQYPMPSPGTQALLGLMDGSNGVMPGGSSYTLSSPGGGQYGADGLYNRPHMPSNLGASSMTAEQAGQMDDKRHGGHATQDADAAASGLFLLAQHSQQHQQQQQHQTQDPRLHAARGAPSMRPPEVNGHYPRTNAPAAPSALNQMGGQTAGSAQDNSPTAKKARRKSALDDGSATAKPAKRGKTAKAAKASVSSSDGEDDHASADDGGDDQKFENDEDKRRNFLERNRQAALKCRQRKKQWLANLQAKVEFYGQENDSLTSQVSSLREEIVNLKTILMQHKDCPVTAAHGGNLGF